MPRRAPRRPTDWQAVVLFGLVRAPCHVVNISPYGAQIRLQIDVPHEGRVIIVGHQFGALDANIVWCKGTRAGVEFTEKDAPARLAPLIAALDAMSPPQFGRRRQT
jgi:hypothetical protein